MIHILKTCLPFIIFVCCYLTSCKQNSSRNASSDSFYTDKGSFDMARIPLIKPYEATTPSTNVNWIVASIDTNDIPVTIEGTKELNITHGMILIHSVNTTLNYQPVKEAWFIIFPKKRHIKGFESHKKYTDLLKQLGLINEPKLYSLGKVFNYFDSHGKVNWNDLE
jgi:hypothetical protein